MFITLIYSIAGIFLFALPSLAQETCSPSQADSLGPFFVANTPVVENLNRFGKPGEPMQIIGEIRSADAGNMAVAGAKVEIWQTDSRGRYYPENNGDISQYADRDIDFRGTVFSDAEGRFQVLSVFPGEYEPRPSHIHYRITAPGFQPLVTQHYPDNKSASRRCQSAAVDRTGEFAVFHAPIIYLLPR